MSYDQGLLCPVLYNVTDLMVDHGEGAYVYTTTGERFLDLTSGIGVTNTGHCHPRVVKAIQDQVAKIIHAQVNVYHHEPVFRLAMALRQVLPERIDTFFFANSGAEAVEGAVKLVRQTTGRPNVIVFQGSFHGRTGQATAMTTSKATHRSGYQPIPSGVFVAPYPYAYRYGWDPEETAQFCLRELDAILHCQTAPDQTAAIVIEPVLGEGGYVVAPTSFMQGLRRLCDEQGIPLIVDEVQSGCGRTGRFFACEHSSIEPDIVLMAKGLGSGFPVSAIAAPRALMGNWREGSHGSTYGSNPVACVAAEATLRVLREERLVENAASRGEQLLSGLRELQRRTPVLGDVRGLGLMVGCELVEPATRRPLADVAKRVLAGCLQQKLILMTCGTYGNVVRWIPPLVVTEEQIDWALGVFGRVLAEVVGRP